MFENQINKQIEAALAPWLQQMEQLKKTVSHQAQLLEQQQACIEALQERLEALEKKEPPIAAEAIPADESTQTDIPQRQPQYLGAPSADGVFREVSHVYEQGKSLYRMEADGAFELLNEPEAIATALISVSQMVKPACKIEGGVSAAARSVAVIERGKAEPMAGGGFAVTKKCVVKLA